MFDADFCYPGTQSFLLLFSLKLRPLLLRSHGWSSHRIILISKVTVAVSQRKSMLKWNGKASHRICQDSMFLGWNIRNSWPMSCISAGQKVCVFDGPLYDYIDRSSPIFDVVALTF